MIPLVMHPKCNVLQKKSVTLLCHYVALGVDIELLAHITTRLFSKSLLFRTVPCSLDIADTTSDNTALFYLH